MTSTSNKSKLLFGIVAILFLSSMVSGYYYSDSDITSDTGFQVPEYDSQEEILTEFVAPFLLIVILLQIGLQRALMFTLDEDQNTWFPPNKGYNKEKKRIKKQSTLMALVIAGMMVPTQLFQIFNTFVTYLFGGALFIFFAVVVGIFFLVLWRGTK